MALAALSALALVRGLAQGVPMPKGSAREGVGAPLRGMSAWPEGWTGAERVVMLAHPGLTALDLVGPPYMFALIRSAPTRG